MSASYVEEVCSCSVLRALFEAGIYEMITTEESIEPLADELDSYGEIFDDWWSRMALGGHHTRPGSRSSVFDSLGVRSFV